MLWGKRYPPNMGFGIELCCTCVVYPCTCVHNNTPSLLHRCPGLGKWVETDPDSRGAYAHRTTVRAGQAKAAQQQAQQQAQQVRVVPAAPVTAAVPATGGVQWFLMPNVRRGEACLVAFWIPLQTHQHTLANTPTHKHTHP